MSETTFVYYPAAEQMLAPAELAQVLGTALESNPKLEQAVRQVLAQRLARATVECGLVALDERAAGHAGGRVAEILSVQHELANYVKQARELAGRMTGHPRPRGRGTARG